MTPAVEGVDLDDTTGCPLAERCEGCGADGDLAVATARTLGGVVCLTLCEPCCDRPLPGWAPLAAVTRVGRHCEHLGPAVDLDVMAAVLDAEDGDR